jgi:quinol monooxygenase YgiN
LATFLAHIQIHPGREAEFERLATEIWAATHRDEPMMRRYEYWRGAEPGRYYTLGSFDGYLGFIAHQVSEHHVEPTAALRDVIASIHLEWIDPVGGASDPNLTPTDNAALPDDASDLARRYAQRQPAEPQAWWTPLREQ